ncbi:MAG: hypothetical protein AAGA77_17995 [Bacteroidota bacterium]
MRNTSISQTTTHKIAELMQNIINEITLTRDVYDVVVSASDLFEMEMDYFLMPEKRSSEEGIPVERSSHGMYEYQNVRNTFDLDSVPPGSNVEYTFKKLEDIKGESRALSNCEQITVEVDIDYSNDVGVNITSLIDLITGLINQLAAMYSNVQINLEVSLLVNWTKLGLSNFSKPGELLNTFLMNTDNFDEDSVQLLSYRANGALVYTKLLFISNPDNTSSIKVDTTRPNISIMGVSSTEMLSKPTEDIWDRNRVSTTQSVEEGINMLPLSHSNFDSGTYFIQVADVEEKEKIDRFIKLK